MLASKAGRVVGVLILAQMAGSWLLNFVLEKPLFGTPGFLVNAAPHATQIAISVLVALAIGAMEVAIATAAFPIFRRSSEALAIWFVVLAGVHFAAVILEQMNVMSMVSLSHAYAGAADRAPFQTVRGIVASSRNWSHYIGLLISGGTLFVLYLVLLRFALVPRALAVCGIFAVLLQLAVIARPLFGRDVVFSLLAPLGLTQLALALWLLARGFREPAIGR